MVKMLNCEVCRTSYAATCCEQIFISDCLLWKPRHEDKVLEAKVEVRRQISSSREVKESDLEAYG